MEEKGRIFKSLPPESHASIKRLGSTKGNGIRCTYKMVYDGSKVSRWVPKTLDNAQGKIFPVY